MIDVIYMIAIEFSPLSLSTDNSQLKNVWTMIYMIDVIYMIAI